MDDLISRQAAIETAKKMYVACDTNSIDDYEMLMEEALKVLPPAEPKRGKWIGKYPVTSVCSECGYLINDSKVKVFAFCPNCGARMEVDNERT